MHMHRRGSTLVEFALVLPILLLLSMMMIQFGIVLNATLTLSHVSREATRFAAVNPYNDAAIKAKVQQITPPHVRVPDANISISPALASRAPNGTISVTITYPMSTKVFLPAKFFGRQLIAPNYTTTTHMRIE
jgi:Flp pilus assembly protein TadG